MRYFTAFVFCALFFQACTEPNPAFVVKEISFPTPTKQEGELHTAIWGDSTGQLLSTDLFLDYPADSFLTEFEIGDIVTVAIIGYDTLEMPVVESTSPSQVFRFLQ